MKKNCYLFVLVGFAWMQLAALAVTERLANPRFHSSMPIRVLLARGGSAPELRSLRGPIFYAQFEHGPWHPVGEVATIKVMKKRGRESLSINGKDTLTSLLYLRYGSSGGPFLLAGRQLPAALEVKIDGDQMLLVGTLPMERYLVGVLHAEMGDSWPLEALKAQAVASRSYAYYRMRFTRSANYDIESTVQDQVYAGTERPTPRILQAVTETQNLVLTENGNVAETLFHSRCGGRTENADSVWSSAKRKRSESVDCPGCKKNVYRWEATVGIKPLLQKLGLPASPQSFALIESNRGLSGRIAEITVAAQDKHRKLTADELRSIIGYHKMRSAFFNWRVDGDQLVFEGTGAGHGVGLCQWGARHLAETGKSFTAILSHYYPTKSLQLFSPEPNRVLQLTLKEPLPQLRYLRYSDGLPNRTSFQSVYSSVRTPRQRLASNR